MRTKLLWSQLQKERERRLLMKKRNLLTQLQKELLLRIRVSSQGLKVIYWE